MGDDATVVDHLRTGLRAAAVPLAGLMLTYLLAVLTPWGRTLDALSSNGRLGTGWSVRAADLIALELVSVATLALALAALVLVGGLRGRWQLGLRSTAAVVGSIVSAEVLKHTLPSHDQWTGRWSLISGGSFPSGHAVVVTSISLAVLSISSDRWRRRLVGPLVAGTAIVTTATVTVGWHRPSDVLASLFLATAWHRAMRSGQPAENRLRTMLPVPARSLLPSVRTATWWAGACALILGAALEGALTGARYGGLASLAYLCSLAVLLAAVLVTIAVAHRPVPVRVRP
jgi:membrane-associated phospholipid phosphatase